MSLLIACRNRNGIVLTADSKAIDVDASGKIVEYKISRMLQLTNNTVILCGGAAAGENMAKTLKKFVAEENLVDVDAVYTAALPFMASEYTELMRKTCKVLPPDPIHHVHFILAGRSAQDSQDPYKIHFLWTKKKRPQLDGDEITAAFTVPRMMRLEYKLNQMAEENQSIESIRTEIGNAVAAQAAENEDIGGPFYSVSITAEGVRIDTF